METRKTITNLTTESVSILTQQFEVATTTETRYETQTQEQEDGEMVEVQVPVEEEVKTETQVGGNHRCAYSNTERGRALLVANEPEETVEEVLAVWGDTATIEETDFSDYVPEPTDKERIAELEEAVIASEIAITDLDLKDIETEQMLTDMDLRLLALEV